MSWEDSFQPVDTSQPVDSSAGDNSGWQNSFVPVSADANPQPIVTSNIGKNSKSNALLVLNTFLNDPGSGAMNAVANMAVGSGEALGDALNKTGLMSDSARQTAQTGFDQFMKTKDDNTSQDIAPSGIPGQSVYFAGEVAPNIAAFNQVKGLSAASLAGARKIVPWLGQGIAKTATGLIPAADAGYATSYIQPADNSQQRDTNAAIGSTLGIVGEGLGGAFNNQVTDPSKQAVMQIAQDNNVPLYRYQVSNNGLTQLGGTVLKKIPGSGAAPALDTQQEAFNAALPATIGQDVDQLSPEVMSRAQQQIGANYNLIGSKYNPAVSDDQLSALGQIQASGADNLVDSKASALQKQIGNIVSRVSSDGSSPTGTLTGTQWANLKSNVGSNLSSDSTNSPQMGQLYGWLKDIMRSHIAQNGAPEDLNLLDNTDNAYRNFLALQRPVDAAPDTPITPNQLAQGVKSTFGPDATGQGNNLMQLSRLGKTIKANAAVGTNAEGGALGSVLHHGLGTLLGLGAVGGGAALGEKEDGEDGAIKGAATGLGALLAARYGVRPYVMAPMSLAPSVLPGAISPLLPSVYNSYIGNK